MGHILNETLVFSLITRDFHVLTFCLQIPTIRVIFEVKLAKTSLKTGTFRHSTPLLPRIAAIQPPYGSYLRVFTDFSRPIIVPI